jgi:hypothetical protein
MSNVIVKENASREAALRLVSSRRFVRENITRSQV